MPRRAAKPTLHSFIEGTPSPHTASRVSAGSAGRDLASSPPQKARRRSGTRPPLPSAALEARPPPSGPAPTARRPREAAAAPRITLRKNNEEKKAGGGDDTGTAVSLLLPSRCPRTVLTSSTARRGRCSIPSSNFSLTAEERP